MSDEIIIPFSTRLLDAAKVRAKEVLGLAKEASKEIKDKLERRQFLADARAQAKATVAQAKERLRLQKVSAAAKLSEATIRPQVNRAFSQMNEAREKGLSVLGSVAGFRSFGGGLSALAGLGGFGPLGAAAAAVAGLMIPIVEKRAEIREKARARVLELRIDREIKRANLAQQLQNAALFRREEERTRGAFGRDRAAQAGFHPRSSRLSGAL